VTQLTPEPTPQRNIFIIFGQGFYLYFKSAKFLLAMTVLAFLPVFVFRMFLPSHYAEAFAEFSVLWQYYVGGGQMYTADLIAAAGNGASIYALLHFAVGLAFLPLMVGATTYLASCKLEDKQPNFNDMFAQVMPRFPGMLATTAIVAGLMFGLLVLTGGTFFVGIPIYFMVTLIFFMHVTADVGRWGLNAMSISRFLVRGRWFKVFFITLLILLTGMGTFVILTAFGGLLGVSASPFAELPFFLAQQFVLSYFMLVFALWYFDTKSLHQRNLEAMEKMVFQQLKDHMENFDFPERPKDNSQDNDKS